MTALPRGAKTFLSQLSLDDGGEKKSFGLSKFYVEHKYFLHPL
jgi:hypothetical protein